MTKLVNITACVLIASAVVFAQGGKAGGKAGPKGGGAGANALRPNLKGGNPKAAFPKGTPKAGPRLTNPASPAARLFRATPDQRERVLEKLPPQQQERMRKELEWFDGLPKDQQETVIKRSERLASLPPEKQQLVTQQMRALNQLPQERSKMVRQALMRLQGMPEEQRQEVLSRDQFRSRFSPEELQIITDLSAVMLPQ